MDTRDRRCDAGHGDTRYADLQVTADGVVVWFRCVLKHLAFHLDEGGQLLIKNHTDSNTGTYVCEAKNAVGQAQCRYNLRAYNRTSMKSLCDFYSEHPNSQKLLFNFDAVFARVLM